MTGSHGEQDDEFEFPESGNLIPPILGLIGVGLLAWGGWVLGLTDNPSGREFSHCASIQDNNARLACYDEINIPHHPAKGAFAPSQLGTHENSQ